MNTEAFGTSIFCDDIRYEINGKISLIGCYTHELVFSDIAPGTLNDFSVLVNIRVPLALSCKTMDLKITKETTQDIVVLFEGSTEFPENTNTEIAEKEGMVSIVSLPIKLPSITFDENGQIKVRAYLDDDTEVRAGVLVVSFPAPS